MKSVQDQLRNPRLFPHNLVWDMSDQVWDIITGFRFDIVKEDLLADNPWEQMRVIIWEQVCHERRAT